MVRTRRAAVMLFAALVCCGAAAFAEVSLPGIFADHMVLQRGMEAPVWGAASPGERVTVTIGGAAKSATADPGGKWSLRLDPMEAGGPYEMTVAGADGALRFADVMVGDVWLCSGQSNMQFTIGRMGGGGDIGDTRLPAVRMVTIRRERSETPLDDFPGGVQEWVVCSPETAADLSAAAFFFGRDLHGEFGVPVGLINASRGGTQAEDWTPRGTLGAHPLLSPILVRREEMLADYPRARAEFERRNEAWKKAEAEGRTDVERPWAPRGASRSDFPSVIYNAVIHPMIPFGIRGAVWYQGESNTQRGYQYRTLLKAMIRSWRDAWGQGTFPFIVIQLANWETDTNPYSPKDGGFWPDLREAQLMALDLPNTALAVTIDLGERDDIHPKNKRDVGLRAALAAKRLAHGLDIEHSGPLFSSLDIRGGTAVVSFSHASGLTARGGGPRGFEIAGADRMWHTARASIEGGTVILSSPDVPHPHAVRYAWDDFPDCSLYNAAGLPASPFRTDDWPRVTQGNLRPFDW